LEAVRRYGDAHGGKRGSVGVDGNAMKRSGRGSVFIATGSGRRLRDQNQGRAKNQTNPSHTKSPRVFHRCDILIRPSNPGKPEAATKPTGDQR
jgi:hypothetical protein